MNPDEKEGSQDPIAQKYTKTFDYMRKYMGKSKKPVLRSEDDLPKSENKPDLSNNHKTIISVTPEDKTDFENYVDSSVEKTEFNIYSIDMNDKETKNTTEPTVKDDKTVTESVEGTEDVKSTTEPTVKDDKTVTESLEGTEHINSTAVQRLNKLNNLLRQKALEKKQSTKFTFFTGLIGFCAFLVAACAAYFSVRGIALLFAGAMFGVLVMASALEIAKLVTASFLYRYWKKLKFLLKFYLTAAVVILIAITSLGIFGYLSDAFETTKNRVENYELQIEKLEGDIKLSEDKISSITNAKTVVDSRSDSAVEDYKKIYDEFVARKNKDKETLINRIQELDAERRVIEAKPGGIFSNKKKELQELTSRQEEERSDIKQKLTKIDSEVDEEYKVFIEKVNSYKSNIIEDSTDDTDRLDALSNTINIKRDEILELKEAISKTDIGSFKFIARAFNLELDTVVKYFITLLVVVFDPLAVTLVLAYNMALLNRHD